MLFFNKPKYVQAFVTFANFKGYADVSFILFKLSPVLMDESELAKLVKGYTRLSDAERKAVQHSTSETFFTKDEAAAVDKFFKPHEIAIFEMRKIALPAPPVLVRLSEQPETEQTGIITFPKNESLPFELAGFYDLTGKAERFWMATRKKDVESDEDSILGRNPLLEE